MNLASLIAKREGKKVQTSIGNIREILKIIRKEIKGPQGPAVLKALLK